MKEISFLVLIKSHSISELSAKLFKMYILLPHVISTESISGIRPAYLRFLKDSGVYSDSQNDFKNNFFWHGFFNIPKIS